jgi:hypothetical protein
MLDLMQELEISCRFLQVLELDLARPSRNMQDLVMIAIILQDLDNIFSKILLKILSKILLKILSRTCRIFQVLAQDPPGSSRIFQELPRT